VRTAPRSRVMQVMAIGRIGLLAALLGGCGTLYSAQHREEMEASRQTIRRLTELIDKEPLRFLAEVTVQTNGLAHDIDALGFDHTLETGAFRHNNEIWFWMMIVRRDQEVTSYAVEPWFPGGPGRAAAYAGLFEEAGWKARRGDRFEWKYHAYQTTIRPVDFPAQDRPALARLMSPYTGHIVPTGPAPDPLRDDFEVAAAQLDAAGLAYLAHALNPATRALAIHHLRCGGQENTPELRTWIDRLLADPTKFRTAWDDIEEEKDLRELIRCDP
jgi:hypothetical protein